ncbi:MAG TPA: 2-oxoacid:acceptor oxidoreductase subunit alpha [Trueperaceae bacterium]|nr:2-oxoacid:acceptor oxidoreductase subunit alpha [Trueperaceae bacterium]
MGVQEPLTGPRVGQDPAAVVNDFSLAVATANGTGSQTANLALLRSFFKMGIPVHGKNIFPSNIQGQPTWYHIRVSRHGYVARREPEMLVAFNAATVHEDVAGLPPGGVCVYNADIAFRPERTDLTYYPVPVKELLADVEVKGKVKEYVANMTYVGVVAHLLGVPLEVVRQSLEHHFGGRAKLVDVNFDVVRRAHAWAEQSLQKVDPYRVEPMDATQGLILMTGNEAAALGAVFGGVSVAAWYPITPSTSLIDALREYLPKLRKDPEGRPTYTVIQAEDELAAIGMTVGAGWAGARSLTATSGPGVSLMAEFLGLAYFAEVPAVVWDIQRVGPSTGLPTRTSQGDVAFAYGIGHGDGKHVVLFPSSIEECFEFGYKAHDLADQLQTPVLVLSDLDLGMNNWMGEPFAYPEEPLQRGKVLSAEEVERLERFSRYADVDGDGIPYRTLPGNQNTRAAWFGRGTGHDEHARYSEDSDTWWRNMQRLARKHDTARQYVPTAVIDETAGARLGVICYGTTRYAIEEARDRLAREGVAFDLMRVRALPFGAEVEGFIARHDDLLVIEMNRDNQLRDILRAELPQHAAKLHGVGYIDGMPLTAEWVERQLLAHLSGRAD